MELEEGDRVRIDIPDESDPDHDRYHGKHGKIISVIPDAGNSSTRDSRDADLFRVEFDGGDFADFSRRDLRPPIDE